MRHQRLFRSAAKSNPRLPLADIDLAKVVLLHQFDQAADAPQVRKCPERACGLSCRALFPLLIYIPVYVGSFNPERGARLRVSDGGAPSPLAPG